MKVLVTGASGLLGRQLYKKLLELKSFDVIGTCFSRSHEGLLSIVLTKTNELETLLCKLSPDVIVHCAAERKPDVVENKTSAAEALNVAATENLCTIAEKLGSWIFYVSTDYVFDGKSAPYSVTDTPNPLNKYGKMKLEGERKVLEANSKHAVLRVPILYGPLEYLSESAVTVLFGSVKDCSKPCIVDHKQRRFPTHTDCVADIIRQMIERHSNQKFSVSGIYHFSEPVMMTKYDMAVSMAKAFDINPSHIQADTSNPKPGSTPRPYDCQLDTSRLTEEGFQLLTADFITSVKALLSSYFP